MSRGWLRGEVGGAGVRGRGGGGGGRAVPPSPAGRTPVSHGSCAASKPRPTGPARRAAMVGPAVTAVDSGVTARCSLVYFGQSGWRG